MARGAAAAGGGQVGHTKGVGGPAAFGLREQRSGVRERDLAPLVVVPEAETPEAQVRERFSGSQLFFFSFLLNALRFPQDTSRTAFSQAHFFPNISDGISFRGTRFLPGGRSRWNVNTALSRNTNNRFRGTLSKLKLICTYCMQMHFVTMGR